jgi:SPP1 family phage portal protein
MTDIKKALESIIAKREGYKQAEAYYEGYNEEIFTHQRWFRLFRNERSNFRFNFSKTVVDAVHNRLEIEQVETTTPEGNDYINQIWEQTDLKLDINEIHKNTLVYGDCYAIVWPDMQGTLAIDYNSPMNTTIIYDQENPRIKSFAAKMWQITDASERKILKVNLYYADRIEKYEVMGDLDTVTLGNNFQLIETVTNPWNEIPVFHFRTNKPYGRPEHADAFGPQDAINKLISTHMFTVDYQGAPQRYALANGGNSNEFDDFSEDDTARENIGALQNGPGQLWYLQGVSSVGQFPAADPKTFTDPVNEFVSDMAAITSTPVHYFSSTQYLPSGQALRVAEAPLFKKVLNRQLALGSTWRDLFKFMLKVEGIVAEIDIDWKSPESIDSLDQWDIAVRKKSVGVPLEQILLELGYDPEIAKLISDEAQPQQQVELPGVGLNTNNMALQQAAAERQSDTTGE